MKLLSKLFLLFALSITVALGQSQSSESSPPSEADTMIGKVAFTFDCAQWGAKGLDHILEVMIRRNIQGTFFCTGKFFEVNPTGAKKIANAGFEVANHSYEHDKKNSIWECNKVAGIYKNLTGKTMTPYFRAPYLYDKEISWSEYARQGWLKGYVSIITCDALPEYKWINDEMFLNNFTTYVRKGAYRRIAIHQPHKVSGPGHINGASILMHIDGFRYHLLEPMIDIVQNHGYVCTTHSQAALVKDKKFTPYSKRGVPMSTIIAAAKAEQRLAPHQRDGVAVFVESAKSPKELSPSGLFPSSVTSELMKDLAMSQNVPIEPEAPMPKLNFHLQDAKPDADIIAKSKQAFSDYEPAEGSKDSGQLALTFNCVEYNPIVLETILNTLKETSVPSTFYVTEEYLKAYPGTIKDILEHGHEIGALESSYYKDKAEGSVEHANSLAEFYNEKTQQQLSRFYRFNKFGGVTSEAEWSSFADAGWKKGSVNLHTCDLNEKWKKVTNKQFNGYFEIYLQHTPTGDTGAVNIAELPYVNGTGSLDGSIIEMHTHGFRYHLLSGIISHAREKGYTFVPQSQIENIQEVAAVEEAAGSDEGLTGTL